MTSQLIWLLLLVYTPFVLGLFCWQTHYGKYDKVPSRMDTNDEDISFSLWNMSRSYLESTTYRKRSTQKKECPELYQRYSSNHTYCKKSTCDVVREGVNEQDKKIILEIHNSLRSKLASGRETRYHQLPPAANMMEMEWDDELAQVAQAHASLCVFAHDSHTSRAVDNFPSGQNLWKVNTGKKNWPGSVVWYKGEVCFYLPKYNKPYHHEKSYSHFTQFTWATSWKIGCGYAAFREGKRKQVQSLYTCNYGPWGNVLGGVHYIVGEPCSQCPKNTECSKKYPGLCKSKSKDGPQKERPSSKEFLLFCDFSKDDPKECDNVKFSGSRNFSTRHIYSGDYKTVVLHGGDSATIDLGNIKANESFCPFLYTRFGPSNAKDPNKSYLKLYMYKGEDILFTSWLESRSHWLFLVTGDSSDSHEGRAVFEFEELPDNASPQFFDIKALGYRRGSCKFSL